MFIKFKNNDTALFGKGSSARHTVPKLNQSFVGYVLKSREEKNPWEVPNVVCLAFN